MNFEDIELATLAYLKQSGNPLVRISVLYAHVTARPTEQTLSKQEYTDFLNNHSEIKVIDPLSITEDDAIASGFQSAGFTTTPCAIFASRVPNPQDLAGAMFEQLQSMTDALSRALEEAQSTGDTAQADQIYITLERIGKMKEKIVAFTKAG